MPPILVGAVIDNPPAPRKRADADPRTLRRAGQTYDAAATTEENRRHWANADSYSALWANSPGVRRTLRNRSRYEDQNNGYVRRGIKTAANDIFGRRGPRCRFAYDDANLNRFLDREFARWIRATGLNRKLRTFLRAKKRDGEALAVLTTNPALKTPVKLDVRLYEAEHLATPGVAYTSKGDVRDRFGEICHLAADGILFDDAGNPIEYHLLREHPGDGFQTDALAFDRLAPEHVVHYFEADRPGQVRGVPEGTTALPLAAKLRRFTEASLSAAEIQASFAGVLETSNPPDPNAPVDSIPGIEIERGMIPTLPDNYRLNAFNPTHPTARYGEFKRELLSEHGAGIGMPFNVLAADSSKHNYSSARLDTQDYHDDVAVERCEVEEVFLDRVRDAWLTEAALIPGYLPATLTDSDGVPAEWYWSGFGFIDPVKEASAIVIRLTNHLTTLKAVHAANGDDWREVIDQRAEEIAYANARGVPLVMAAAPASPPADERDDEEDVVDEQPAGEEERWEGLAWIR